VKLAGCIFVALIVPTLPALGQPATGPAAPHRPHPAGGLQQCLARTGDPFGEDRCYNREVERQEGRLARAVVAARAYLVRLEREARRPGFRMMEDIRRDPAYLDRSQAAWRVFVDHDCNMRAGLLAGASVWVSRAYRSCYLDELDRRSTFLESIVSGAFTAA
jgi:uncharacterized protein YecT (DUF1311 family)